MTHIELAEQLYNPYATIALCINLVLLLLPPAIALLLADGTTRRVALSTAVLAVGLRLVGWTSIPGGLGTDDYATLRQMGHQAWTFHSLVGENWDNGGNLISNLPWYLAYRLSGSLLAIRFVGTLWSCSLAILVSCFASRLYGPFAALVCSSFATLTVWSLFISRLTFGSEILVLQTCVLWTCWRLKQQLDMRETLSLGLIIVSGMLAGLSQYTYLAARVIPVIPVIIVGVFGFKRLNTLGLIAAVAFTCWYPYLATEPRTLFSSGSQLGTLLDPKLMDPAHALNKAAYVLRSFVDPAYSAGGTNAMQGAHTIGWIISCLVLIGAPFAPRFLLIGLVGMLPALLSTLPAGGSHRMMMMLVPFALVAGAAVPRLPVRLQKWAGIVLCTVVVVVSTRTWLSTSYWSAADVELQCGVTAHRVAHRALAENPNSAVLGRISHQLLIGQETGQTLRDLSMADCSQPFTLIIEGNTDQSRAWAEAFRGELVPGTRDQLVVLHLAPEDAHRQELRELAFCRPDLPDSSRLRNMGDRTAAGETGAALPNRAVMRQFERHLALWLEADAIAGLGDGEPVAVWPDSSGVTRGAMQSDRRRRPTLRAEGRNRLAVVRFSSSATQSMVVQDLSLAAHGTHFYVLRHHGAGGQFPFFEHGPDFNSRPGSLLYGSSPMFGVYREGSLHVAQGLPAWLGAEWAVVSVVYDGDGDSAAFRIRKNGVLQDNGKIQGSTRSDTVETAAFHIGSRQEKSYWADMDLVEIILLNRPLALAEVEVIENHLLDKWGIPLDKEHIVHSGGHSSTPAATDVSASHREVRDERSNPVALCGLDEAC